MTRFRYGTLAGVAGAAFALYNWWRRRPDYVARQMSQAGHGGTLYPADTTTRNPAGGAVV